MFRIIIFGILGFLLIWNKLVFYNLKDLEIFIKPDIALFVIFPFFIIISSFGFKAFYKTMSLGILPNDRDGLITSHSIVQSLSKQIFYSSIFCSLIILFTILGTNNNLKLTEFFGRLLIVPFYGLSIKFFVLLVYEINFMKKIKALEGVNK